MRERRSLERQRVPDSEATASPRAVRAGRRPASRSRERRGLSGFLSSLSKHCRVAGTARTRDRREPDTVGHTFVRTCPGRDSKLRREGSFLLLCARFARTDLTGSSPVGGVLVRAARWRLPSRENMPGCFYLGMTTFSKVPGGGSEPCRDVLAHSVHCARLVYFGALTRSSHTCRSLALAVS